MTESNELENDYSRLEDLYIQYIKTQKEFYKLKYQYRNTINHLKEKYRPGIDYKSFSEKIRRDLKKRRKHFITLKKIPKSLDLDHKIPILYYFLKGIDDPEIINNKDNLEYIPRRNNKIKGILRWNKWLELDY